MIEYRGWTGSEVFAREDRPGVPRGSLGLVVGAERGGDERPYVIRWANGAVEWVAPERIADHVVRAPVQENHDHDQDVLHHTILGPCIGDGVLAAGVDGRLVGLRYEPGVGWVCRIETAGGEVVEAPAASWQRCWTWEG